ncbi:hypothetical protein glysoja_036498, partial [Glycine soja]
IGNGHITRFWEDSWLEGDTLASFFLRLYNNSLQHGVCIEKMGRWASGKCEWAFSWRRSWFVWESLMVDPFMGKLQNCNFVQGVPNVWVWSTDNSNLEIPPKAQFMVWRLILGRLLTKINLVRRNIV